MLEAPAPTGMARYLDSHPEIREQHPRIYVKIRPAGTDLAFWALLDTGAHFCLLNVVAASLVRDQLTDSLGTFRVQTAGGPSPANCIGSI